MEPTRVIAFVDGFNLYHAVDDLGTGHLKWLNLRALCEAFTPAPRFSLDVVLYFSAYATWRKASYARHRAYVSALKAVGVTPVLGRFKEKSRDCRRCGNSWTDHEEKETDVNIALYLYREAMRDNYDRALLISGDSDLAPAVRFVLAEFPDKDIRVIAPVGRDYSMDLVQAAGGTSRARKMKRIHVERALLPREVTDSRGGPAAVRPVPYDPPVGSGGKSGS